MKCNNYPSRLLFILVLLFVFLPLDLSVGVIFERFDIDLNATDQEVSITIKWSEKEQVSTIDSSQSYHPNIQIDSEKNLHIVWQESTSPTSIYYSCYISRNDEWLHPQQISNVSDGSANYPVLALDEEDNVYVLWRQSGPQLVYRSKIDGLWSALSVIASCNTIVKSHDLVVDRSQNIHIIWSDKWDSYNHNLYHKIFDGLSLEWSPTNQLTINNSYASFYPNLAVDGLNRVHLTWIDLNDSCLHSEVFYQYYANSDWYPEFPLIVSPIDDNTALHPIISVDNKNVIHFVWEEFSSPKDLIYYTKLEGGMLSDAVTLNSNTAHYPDVCCDESGNTHLVWIENNVLNYKRLNSLGKWSKTVTLIDTNSTTSSSAKIAVSNKGSIHIIWNDFSFDSSWNIYHIEGIQLNYYAIIVPISGVVIITSGLVVFYFIRKSKKYKKDKICT